MELLSSNPNDLVVIVISWLSINLQRSLSHFMRMSRSTDWAAGSTSNNFVSTSGTRWSSEYLYHLQIRRRWSDQQPAGSILEDRKSCQDSHEGTERYVWWTWRLSKAWFGDQSGKFVHYRVLVPSRVKGFVDPFRAQGQEWQSKWWIIGVTLELILGPNTHIKVAQ